MSAVKIIAIGDNVCDKYLSRGKMYPGGQCVNTCAYAAANGVPSAYLGKFGSDEVAAYNQKILHELGIDISQCLTVPGGATSTYLFITDGHGDMALAVSDMEIYEHVTPAFLAGYRRVDEAVGDERFARYLRLFMDRDAGPYVPPPGNTDLELYKKTLLERFGNKAVSDQISRLCFDGVSKIPVYVMPVLTKMIRDGATWNAWRFSWPPTAIT